jgi:hypothetical protein
MTHRQDSNKTAERSKLSGLTGAFLQNSDAQSPLDRQKKTPPVSIDAQLNEKGFG